jgi:translation elongation factor EF-Ts
MELNAKDVMKLRDKTGLPMMACKSALIEARATSRRRRTSCKQMKGRWT